MPLAASAGRVLAAAFDAPADLPGERRSVMDGFAVRAADVRGASASSPVVLAVIGNVPMGEVFTGAIAAGQAVAIATGGVVPEGGDAVVMVEHTAPAAGEGGGDRVLVSREVTAGANVVQPGEDVRRGGRLLQAGRRLRPQDVAVLGRSASPPSTCFAARAWR